MDQINLTIDADLGSEIKKYTDQGFVITGVQMLKGFKSNPDIYFLSLSNEVPVQTVKQSITVPAGTERKRLADGEPEKIEAKEPMPAKPIVVTHSADPSKPTLADLVDRIIKTNKDNGFSGKALADQCITEVMDMRDPVTKLTLPTEVQKAIQAYLNQELSK